MSENPVPDESGARTLDYAGLNILNFPAGILAPFFVRRDGTLPLTAKWFADNYDIISRNSDNLFNVEAFQAAGTYDPTGAVASSAVFQAAINAAGANGGIVQMPPGRFAVSGLTLLAKRGVTLRGTGYGYFPNGGYRGTTLVNAGGNGSTILSIVDCQECNVDNFNIDGNQPADMGVTGLLIDSDNAPVSRMISVSRLGLLRADVGIQLNSHAAGESQTDSMTFDRIYAAEGNATSSAIVINSQNAGFWQIRDSVLLDGLNGVRIIRSSPGRIINTYGGAGGLQKFINIEGVCDQLLIDQCQAEAGAKFLEIGAAAASNIGEAVMIRGCTIDLPIDVLAGGPWKFASIGNLYHAAFTLNNAGSELLSLADTLSVGGSFVPGATDKLVSLGNGSMAKLAVNTYANNAAALAGGLVPGVVYATIDAISGDFLLKIVHV